jgi:hypothetical protein
MLSKMRRTAAEMAAAALVETYPNVEILETGETATGFSCSFHCPHPVHLHAIEERMRQIVREKRPIRTLEMVPFSANELLKSLHQPPCEATGGLVELIQIGSWAHPSEGPHLKNTAELAAFKLELSGNVLSGFCHTSKEELKQYLKMLASYTEPHVLGERRRFWQGDLWLPEGLKMRERLIEFLKKEWGALEVAGPVRADLLPLHRTCGQPVVAERVSLGAFHVTFFAPSENSHLHLIGKTLTILGFDHTPIRKGFGCEYLVPDGIGRSRPVVRVKKVGPDFASVVDVEGILLLLLEKNLLMGKLENQ